MEPGDCVISAGRAVLDMVEQEWQPLSQNELELRLDQAVEELLEADLLARVTAQPQPPAPVYLHVMQTQASMETESLSTQTPTNSSQGDAAETQEALEDVDSAAVKYITELLQSSNSKARLAGRARLSLSHTVLLSLTLLSKRISYRSVSSQFRLEKGNIHRIFFSFCERVIKLQEEQVTWPSGAEAVDVLVPFSGLLGNEKEGREEPGFPQVLGVLGHTRIPIRLPIGKHDVESVVHEVKRMKKEAHPDSWLNLELVCDRTGRFLHCRISKGSDVDRAGALRDRLEQHPDLLPPGSCLVARAGYPLTAHILTPFTDGHGQREELFNQTLETHLDILDQAVAKLKARFQRLRYLDIGNYERASAVVSTACVLHNVFLNMGQNAPEGQTEEAATQEGEGETEEAGVRRRDAISDLLHKKLHSGAS
ncbi:putative nuclease HARBI1 [Genypterus blacodes]|uniref:putative nuclease HARBI1 n=1 Tax=Genypterus blacodes TaxID=154954 RepID=UPI003F76B0C9